MLDFRYYLAVFIRRLPYFLVFLAVGVAFGLAAALVLPPVYEAQARLVVESEQIPDELAASTVRTGTSEQLQIIQQRILTRNALLDMVNRLDIYSGANAPSEPMSPDMIVADLRDRIRISSSGGRDQAILVTVSFSAPTGQMAARVTNDVVELILQENVAMRTTVSGQTLDFFSQQVDQLEQQLTDISNNILTFKEANDQALPDSLDFRRSQQAAAQERLLEQERAESVLRDRRDRLEKLYAQTGSVSGMDTTVGATAEEQRLKQLRDEQASLLAVLSPQNPRIVIIRQQIDALERIVSEQNAAGAGSVAVDANTPVLSEYELRLAEIDGQLDFIATQKARIEEDLDTLGRSIAATPENALTLTTLEREFNAVQARYNQAVQNKARAETGDVIESLSKGERFSVIEQANVPSSPSSPDRPKIAALGVIGGIGMGLGFIALLEVLNSSIRRPVDIVNELKITPLVTFPYIRTRYQVWRRRMIVLAVVLILIVGLPGALWYVDTNVTPLLPFIERVAVRLGLG